MRIGIQLPEVEREVRWPELLAIARAAEDAGFDSIWLGDHLLYRGDGRPERGPWDAWTQLAALAASTERVRLGPLVACAGFHPPGLIARMAASIDEVSDGRFVLGLGAGWNEQEFSAFGIPFDHRVTRFEESFASCAACWRASASRSPAASGRPTTRSCSRLRRAHAADDRQQRAAHAGHRAAARGRLEHLVGRLRQQRGRLRRAVRAHQRCRARRRPRAGGDRAQRLRAGRADGRRPASAPHPIAPLSGSPQRIAAHLLELAEAGADEAILVADPITERSIRELAEVVALARPAA